MLLKLIKRIFTRRKSKRRDDILIMNKTGARYVRDEFGNFELDMKTVERNTNEVVNNLNQNVNY